VGSSPTTLTNNPVAKYLAAESCKQQAGGDMGFTIAFVAIIIGGVEVTQVGPFDVAGAQEMSRVIERDVQRSYDEWHPHGWTDGSGTIYRMSDWEFEIQTMHSSEYLERQRQENQ
jgi:hypothetical protein